MSEVVRELEANGAADPAFARWAAGYGPIRHTRQTQARVRTMVEQLAAQGLRGDGVSVYDVHHAADRIASAGMWLVVHETYARNVYLDGRALSTEDFKPAPEGHTGGALNMVPAYTGYMAVNAITGATRAWLMGQGHCVAAVDSVNLLLGNMTAAHAARYDLTEAGLTRYVRDFSARSRSSEEATGRPGGGSLRSTRYQPDGLKSHSFGSFIASIVLAPGERSAPGRSGAGADDLGLRRSRRGGRRGGRPDVRRANPPVPEACGRSGASHRARLADRGGTGRDGDGERRRPGARSFRRPGLSVHRA